MKQLIATAIIMAAGVAYASSPSLHECIYRYKTIGNDQENVAVETTDCILLIGENRSKFYDYSTFRVDSVSAIPDAPEETVDRLRTESLKIEAFFDQEVNASLTDNSLTVFSDMSPDRYRYEEKLPLINWTLTDETDTICGYACRKGTGEYGGRKWTAWYAEEIAVPFGPWKICGLPGLVMKAEDATGQHSFQAIAFRKGTGEVKPSAIPNQIPIKHEKFTELKNRYDRDPFSSIDPESISEITVNNKNVYVNGVRIRQHKKGHTPLEYSPAELDKIAKGEDPYSGKGASKKGKTMKEEPIKVTSVKMRSM